MIKLLYVDQQVADELKDRIHENVERYRNGDFLDHEANAGWRIPLSIEADLGGMMSLRTDSGSDAEIENSIVVGRSLGALTPTLARENRLWIRLSHVECLAYSRGRWLRPGMADDDIERKVAKHFFAPTLTGCRDDHAVSRLWWNYHIAKQIMPDAPERALRMMLARADIRLNFLERPGIAARPVLAKSIVRALEDNRWLLDSEPLFRSFMKTLNLRGAGIAFEVWSDASVDRLMTVCLELVKTWADQSQGCS